MYGNLEIMRMASALVRHAGERQDVVARNIANADTPGFRARDVVPFAKLYEGEEMQGLRATRPGHVGAAEAAHGAPLVEIAGKSSPNGNSVSLEAEMMRSAEVRHEHELATSIYRSSLDILRTSIGRR